MILGAIHCKREIRRKWHLLLIQNYNFSVVLYGCESWSIKLNEEQTGSAQEQGAEENILTRKRSNKRTGKIAK
jgi:hypothetical protein